MGHGYSVGTQTPPGGSVHYVQNPHEQCAPNNNQLHAMPALQGAAIPPNEFDEFKGRLNGLVATFVNENRTMLLIIPVVVTAAFLASMAITLLIPDSPFSRLVNIVSLIGIGGGIFVHIRQRSANQGVDSAIAALCGEYTARWSGAHNVFVRYDTAHTGVCKPKHARTMRALVFGPLQFAGAVPSAGMQPQVPQYGVPQYGVPQYGVPPPPPMAPQAFGAAGVPQASAPPPPYPSLGVPASSGAASLPDRSPGDGTSAGMYARPP